MASGEETGGLEAQDSSADPELIDATRRMWSDSDPDAVLRYLHDQGISQMAGAALLVQATGMPLVHAKRIVQSSPVWIERARGDERHFDDGPLTERELDVVGAVLRGIASGPFIDDWEFSTVMGCERAEVEAIAGAWPEIEGADAQIAINNAFVNLLGYPHGDWKAWTDFSDASPKEVADVYGRWRATTNRGAPRSYFEDLA